MTDDAAMRASDAAAADEWPRALPGDQRDMDEGTDARIMPLVRTLRAEIAVKDSARRAMQQNIEVLAEELRLALRRAHDTPDLRPWVQHKPECTFGKPTYVRQGVPSGYNWLCSCGLDAAIREREGERR